MPLRLQRHKNTKNKNFNELSDNTYETAHLENVFFVFKDGKYFIPVTKENAESVLPFFGIKAI